MQKIINLIIERLEDLKALKRSIKIYRRASQEDRQINNFQRQRIRNLIDDTDVRQNNRVKQQLQLFSHIGSLKLITEKNKQYFIELSMKMFKTYDRHFQNQFGVNNKFMSEIAVIYQSFLIKHADQSQYQYFLTYLRKQMDSLSPLIYLEWISEWSKNFFNDLTLILQQSIKNQQSKQYWNKLKDNNNTLNQQQNALIDLPINSRESLFGYLSTQLDQHYRMVNILDLDMNYIKNMKKIQKKQEFSIKNLQEIVDKLIKKNHLITSNAIRQYQILYSKYRNRIKINKKIQNSKNMVNRLKKSIFRKQENVNKQIKYHYSRSQREQSNLLASSNNNFINRTQFPMIQSNIKFDHLPTKQNRLKRKIKTQEQNNEKYYRKEEVQILNFKPISIVVISSPQNITAKRRYVNTNTHNSLKRHIKNTLHNYEKIKKKLNVDLNRMLNTNVECFDDYSVSQQWNKALQIYNKPKNIIIL